MIVWYVGSRWVHRLGMAIGARDRRIDSKPPSEFDRPMDNRLSFFLSRTRRRRGGRLSIRGPIGTPLDCTKQLGTGRHYMVGIRWSSLNKKDKKEKKDCLGLFTFHWLLIRSNDPRSTLVKGLSVMRRGFLDKSCSTGVMDTMYIHTYITYLMNDFHDRLLRRDFTPGRWTTYILVSDRSSAAVWQPKVVQLLMGKGRTDHWLIGEWPCTYILTDIPTVTCTVYVLRSAGGRSTEPTDWCIY